MSSPYEELLQGAPMVRVSPGSRHEQICARLHRSVRASVANLNSTCLLAPRSAVRVAPDTVLRPDLALMTVPNNKLWLAAEIVSSEDHAPDTVMKKQIYEEIRLPRLWMVDPRYDNVEVYHATQYGMVLKGILAGSEILSEKLLPEFQIVIQELFKAEGA
ncbi:MAG TPA: Uma2 family endonuclease [Patescibacteria group bacterium]|nr:Uma2 family endonuclease [Patescibacteria group bacterium]